MITERKEDHKMTRLIKTWKESTRLLQKFGFDIEIDNWGYKKLKEKIHNNIIKSRIFLLLFFILIIYYTNEYIKGGVCYDRK